MHRALEGTSANFSLVTLFHRQANSGPESGHPRPKVTEPARDRPGGLSS